MCSKNWILGSLWTEKHFW